MNPGPEDPLHVLYTTTDPERAAWAMNELQAAGFDARRIAADFGWQIRRSP